MPIKQPPKLYIVVPCYNEQEVLRETVNQLSSVIREMVSEDLVSSQSSILFVDDGSKDDTWHLIREYSASNPHICGLKLAVNVGHQRALFAGIMKAKEHADCVISIDADLQDDPLAMREFVLRYREGYEIVYGVRQSRQTDSFFKRTTALGFYRFMEWMGVNLVYNHADYRLMGKRALGSLEQYKEVNLFLRGMIPQIGFKSTTVGYDRLERFAGKSKYPLNKMLSFAFDGMTSFSIRPIRLVTVLGFIIFGMSVFAGSYAILSKMLGDTVSGWTSLILSVWFLGGVQLLALGLIGEYIGKMYKEVKRRPPYRIETEIRPAVMQIKNRKMM
jgi:glycosyltransferase involved in cell wall biosynthesis